MRTHVAAIPNYLICGSGNCRHTIFDACGGGGSNGGVNPVSSNVALASSGASVSSNISTGTEHYVIDGNTDTTYSWQANTDNDYLTIEFSQLYDIESVTVVATDLELSDYAGFSIAISTTGIDPYTPLNNKTSCTAYSLTTSGYGCEFSATHSARYFRFTVLNNANTPQIHEIEVMGK